MYVTLLAGKIVERQDDLRHNTQQAFCFFETQRKVYNFSYKQNLLISKLL